MATFRKRGDRWQAQVRRRGVFKSETFGTKQAAQIWARGIEAEIDAGVANLATRRPVRELLHKYRDTVSPHKQGARWEVNRLNALAGDPLADVPCNALDAPHIAQWRDRRLQSVSGETVNREWNLLSAVFTVAINEWRMLDRHPMTSVRRPAGNPPRERLALPAEVEALRHVMRDTGETITSRVFIAFLFALETGMRRGEIAGLTDVRGRVAYLAKTKNGDARQVPLSTEAARLWDAFGPFGLTPQQIDVHFRKACAKAGIVGLHFHDSRATAITRLAKRLDILTLARMIGHRDLKSLQVYYRETAEDTAKRLD